MKRFAGILTVVLSFIAAQARSGNTNVLIIPSGDQRAGAIFFTDECLTRGLTNSISIGDLRKWATNTIRKYQEREAKAAASQSSAGKHSRVLEADVPETIRSIQERIPSCRSDAPVPIDGWDKFVKEYSKAWSVSEEEAGRMLRTIGPDPARPEVVFWRSTAGAIQAVDIRWYIYGVVVGPESFKPDWDAPWYHRKLADGVYLWHGYK